MKKLIPIYVERLRDGRVLQIDEKIDPKILDITDSDVCFSEPITITGKVYIVEDFLLVQLTICANMQLTCSVCNDLFCYPITISGTTIEMALDEITDAVFDLFPVVRESVLLEIPFYPQCVGASCKNRHTLDCYFTHESFSKEKNTHFKPFENL